ncbi:MAG: tyrosine-type recombinase/integrase [Planctomycetes bacterium]|nr:tyrosine-type recombinase/integrase [Planctomycetota bacterium]
MRVEGDHNRTVIEAYLKALKRRRYSPKTIATYRYPLTLFASFFQPKADPPSAEAASSFSRLQDITRDDLAAWRLDLIERGLADASLEVFLRAARNLFNWMEAEGMLFDNPAAALKTPRYERKLLPVPSEAELRRLLAPPAVTTPVGIRDRAVMEVGYCCALRREELARLTLRDPDFLQKTLRVLGKGSRERMLPLGEEAFTWLRRYVEDARPALLGRNAAAALDVLWISTDGKPFGGQGISVMLKKYGREAKLSVNITPHSLRRACATHMLQRGAHPVQIQMLLGHATMRHLAQYLRLTITDIKRMHAQSRPGK